MDENSLNVIKKKKVLQIHETVNSTDGKNKESIPKHTIQLLKIFKKKILKATRRKMTQHLQGTNDKND